MTKIKRIIKGWKGVILGYNPDHKELFENRLNTCNSCEFLCAGICTSCGCVVKAKTKVLSETCPENRWEPEVYSHNGLEFILLSDAPSYLSLSYRAKNKIAPLSGLPDDAVLLDSWLQFLDSYS